MRMLKGSRALLRSALPASLLAAAAWGAESRSTLEIKNEYFLDRNGAWNYTPAFSLKLAMSRVWSFLWDQEFDFVTGASRRIGLDKVGPFGDRQTDAVSGASKVELRYSENPGLAFAYKGFAGSGSFYYSRERDYISLSPSFSFSVDLFERNTTLGATYAEFYDHFNPVGAFKFQGGQKFVQSAGLTLAQSLSPLTLAGLTVNLVRSTGYLGHPYNPPMDFSGT